MFNVHKIVFTLICLAANSVQKTYYINFYVAYVNFYIFFTSYFFNELNNYHTVSNFFILWRVFFLLFDF